MARQLFPAGVDGAVRDARLGAAVRLLDLLLAVAAVCRTVGFGLVWLPLAPIVAGLSCVAAWWLLGEVKR